MKLKLRLSLFVSLLLVCSSGGILFAGAPAKSEQVTKQKTVIARVWHGRTQAKKADEYYAYLQEAGVKKIQKIPGNLGVQVFRRTSTGVTEFTVISYWKSLDAIRQFAGNDIEKTHNLPRDPQYLIKLEPTVKHYEVVFDERKR